MAPPGRQRLGTAAPAKGSPLYGPGAGAGLGGEAWAGSAWAGSHGSTDGPVAGWDQADEGIAGAA
jgi:hypothetical protein